MIRDSLVVIPSILSQSEVCDYVSQTAMILAKKGNRVYVINFGDARSLKEVFFEFFSNKRNKKFSKKINDVVHLQPIFLLPLRRLKVIEYINTIVFLIGFRVFILFSERQCKSRFLWLFFPQLVQAVHIFKGYFKVYDIVDYFSFPNFDKKIKLTRKKKHLLEKSDLIIANSFSLKKAYLEIDSSCETYVVPQGFRVQDFFTPRKKYQLKVKKPIVGYVGKINERLDFKLLSELVADNSQWNFVFVGPKTVEQNVSFGDGLEEIESLFSLKNAIWVKKQPKENIPAIIQKFDVCMIPYDISYEFNKLCYPMKLFEYFYMGRPVVSTPIEELRRFPKYVKIGKNIKEWEKHISILLSKPWSIKLQKMQRNLAVENSWENKVEVMSDILESKLNS